MSNIKLNREAQKKEESRKIVKEILNFGITEKQKIDIIYFLSMTISDNDTMKKICAFLKEFKSDLSNQDSEKTQNKLIL